MSSSRVVVTGFDPAGSFADLLLPVRFLRRQAETRFKQEWRLSKGQYLAMMREFIGPRRQRGNLAMLNAVLGDAGGVVVLTAQTFGDFAASGTATATIRFEDDGELRGIREKLSDFDFTGEWWSDEDEAGIGNSYAARHLAAGKTGTYSTEAATADNWITISATRDWSVQRGTPIGSKQCVATFEVGPQPSGPADDSAVIDITADFDDS